VKRPIVYIKKTLNILAWAYCFEIVVILAVRSPIYGTDAVYYVSL